MEDSEGGEVGRCEFLAGVMWEAAIALRGE